jgi:uncharacterized protein with PQ loop repeat
MTFTDPLEILGLVAGAFGTLASLPQAIKIVRTRSAEDVSLMMFLLAMTGCVLWGIYGWQKGAVGLHPNRPCPASYLMLGPCSPGCAIREKEIPSWVLKLLFHLDFLP